MPAQEQFTFADMPVIKGYPELRWTGKHPYRSTLYYPAQLKETYGTPDNEWMNKLYWGDNLQVMSHLLREYRGSIDLVYIDPPFDSKADYKKQVRLRGKSVTNDRLAFEEKQYGDIWSSDEYLQFMFERLILIKELLSDVGTLYLHCDSHQSHHLRCLLDEVFGPENCHNELTWKRSHAQGNAGQGIKQFGIVTDTIFIYSKTNRVIWNQQYLPYSDEIIARDYKYIDEDTGERYRLTPVDGPGGASKGNPFYEFLGVSGYWRYSKETMTRLYEAGEIVLSSTGRSLSRKRYLKDAKGTPVTNLWDDVNRVSPTSSERVGYPTQKPECLLERIVLTSSNPGSIVFDCFMGSGTTQAVAMRLGRRFIGADINIGSIQTTTKRLLSLSKSINQSGGDRCFTGFELYNVNNYDFFRNPVEARDLLIQALDIQPFDHGHVYDGELDGRMVKLLPTNRIATKADLTELVANLPYSQFDARREENPNEPVERITLVCMGHDPDLKASLEQELGEYKVDIEVFDVLRDRSDLQLKREAEADVIIVDGKLVIRNFWPMNLLQKLSMEKESVEDWREMVESVLVDWNYDGAVMEPSVIDIPEGKGALVSGTYDVPADAGTVRIKITDVLSESLEVEVRA